MIENIRTSIKDEDYLKRLDEFIDQPLSFVSEYGSLLSVYFRCGDNIDYSIVKDLLEGGVPINAVNFLNETCLFIYCERK
jgi:hypothetical protein